MATIRNKSSAGTSAQVTPPPKPARPKNGGASAASTPPRARNRQASAIGAPGEAAAAATGASHRTLSSLRLPVKAHIETAFRLPNGLLLAGWVFDPDDLVRSYCLLDKAGKVATHDLFEEESGSRCYRLPRPDVSACHPGALASGDDHGFLAYVPIDRREAPQFALELKSGTLAAVEHSLDRTAQDAAGHLESGLSILANPLRRLADEIPEVDEFLLQYLSFAPDQDGYDSDVEPETGAGRGGRGTQSAIAGGADARHAIETAKDIKTHVDLALKFDKGVLVVGWIWDPKQVVRNWGLGASVGQSGYLSAASNKPGNFFRRTARPDVATTFGSVNGQDDWCGFVMYVGSEAKDIDALVVRTRSAETFALPLSFSGPAWDAWAKFEAVWPHSGAAIRRLALSALPKDHAMRNWLEDFAAAQLSKAGAPLMVVEKGVIVEDSVLVLEGWIPLAKADIASLELWQGTERQDLLPDLVQMPRPDVSANLNLPHDARPGYVSISRINRDLKSSFRLRLQARDGRVQFVFLRPTPVDLHYLLPTLVNAWDAADRIVEQIVAIAHVANRIQLLHAQAFAVRWKDLPLFVENRSLGSCAVDRGFPLEDGGLLVFGWKFFPEHKPRSIAVRTAEGERIEIAGRMFPLPRLDVKASSRARFPQVTDACGYVVHVPLPTAPGAMRMLEYDFGDAGMIWQKIPTGKPDQSGVALIREILQWIPAPERIGSRLGTLLGECIAPAVASVLTSSLAANPVSPQARQFGTAPAKPIASVVVPLYGRYDFLRHQVAHFVDDPDFRDVDLIYVLDDPDIEHETLHTAARVHALFGLPFRVVSYGRNLGFGGANNVGAAFATAKNLLLLNSDILPIAPGWVSGLAHQIKTLKSARAVAPLLLFHDGMVQHAGMTSGPSAEIDGLLVNRHPGKGLPWSGGDAPFTADLLTAACLMVRTDEYRQNGGFDESYIVGDYEDSDLCRRLAGKDGRLYMVPKYRLWHLERQSQALGTGVSQRMLITIMNGMRYSKSHVAGKEK